MFPECANPGLISLVDRAKHAKPDILGAAIRKNWELVEEARRLRIPWGEIADALGFQGKGPLARASYSRERRRRAGAKLAQKTEDQKTENGKQNEVRPPSTAMAKPNPGRVGTPRPIGRGRLDLGADTQDDEL